MDKYYTALQSVNRRWLFEENMLVIYGPELLDEFYLNTELVNYFDDVYTMVVNLNDCMPISVNVYKDKIDFFVCGERYDFLDLKKVIKAGQEEFKKKL